MTMTSRRASGVYFAKAKIDGTGLPDHRGQPECTGRPTAPQRPWAASAEPDRAGLGRRWPSSDKHVGDTVDVSGGRRKPTRLTIVGTATMPALIGPGMGSRRLVDYRLIPAASPQHAAAARSRGPTPTSSEPEGPRRRPCARSSRSSDTINAPAPRARVRRWGDRSVLRPEEIVDSHSIVAIPAVLGAGLADRARSWRWRRHWWHRSGVDVATWPYSRHSASPVGSSAG